MQKFDWQFWAIFCQNRDYLYNIDKKAVSSKSQSGSQLYHGYVKDIAPFNDAITRDWDVILIAKLSTLWIDAIKLMSKVPILSRCFYWIISEVMERWCDWDVT